MGVAELHTRLRTPLIASAPLSALRAPLWLPCMHPEMAWELRCPMPCFCLTNTDSQDCGVFVCQPHSPSSSWQGAELDDNVASKTTMAQAGARSEQLDC